MLVRLNLKLDCDLRRQLGMAEAEITAEYAQLLAEAIACTSLHIDANNTPDSPDSGATPHSLPWSNGELDRRHD